MTTKKKPIILQDIDGCLLSWLSKLPEFLVKRGIDPTRTIMAIGSNHYRSGAELTGLPAEEAMRLVYDYNRSEYMKYLVPFQDAIIPVNLLKEDYDFVAITAIGDNPESKRYRMENLNFWFPNAFSEIHTVNLGESKTKFLEMYEPTIFVDDSPEYCKEAKECGHTAIRLVRDSRPDMVGTMRFDSFGDVANYILGHPNCANINIK